MSTKIYNAYKYNGTIQELWDDLQIIREEVRDAINKLCLEVARESYIDNKGELNKDTLYDDIRRQMNIQYPSYNDIFAFGQASIVIYPYNNALYFQLFGLDVSRGLELSIPHMKKLMESGKIQDYHYQNQTDPYYEYDGTTYTDIEFDALEEDWERRRIVWDEIFEKSDVPKFAGLTFHIHNTYYSMYQYIVENFDKKEQENEQSKS